VVIQQGINFFYQIFFSPRILAGKNKIALNSESIASAAIPTIRNGIDNSHTIGHNSSANNATGQHNTNNIAHNNNMTNTFIERLLLINLYSHYIPPIVKNHWI
jgi:hypothetical protein